MQDYFIWNGTDCRQYGIHVTEQPPVTIPAERSTQINVPGRPGSLIQLEGEDVYDDLLLTATCFISDPAQIPAIAAWLKGSSMVTFANRTGGYYRARIANQIPFEKVLRGNPHCTFAVNFRCFPFWYQENVADELAYDYYVFDAPNMSATKTLWNWGEECYLIGVIDDFYIIMDTAENVRYIPQDWLWAGNG